MGLPVVFFSFSKIYKMHIERIRIKHKIIVQNSLKSKSANCIINSDENGNFIAFNLKCSQIGVINVCILQSNLLCAEMICNSAHIASKCILNKWYNFAYQNKQRRQYYRQQITNNSLWFYWEFKAIHIFIRLYNILYKYDIGYGK